MTCVNVDTNQTDKLLRLLDTVVIKLEGGTDEDLKVLDEKPNIEQRPEPIKEPLSVSAVSAANAAAAAAATNATSKIGTLNIAAEAKSDDGAINDEDSNDVKEVLEPIVPAAEPNAADKVIDADEKPSKKRKRTTSGSSSSSSSSTSSSGKRF